MTSTSALYGLELDCSTNNAGLPRDKFEDGIRVRVFGNNLPRHVVIPSVVVGAAFFFNDGNAEITLRCGPSIPIKLDRGDIVHVFFDGKPGGMRKVGY